MGAYPDGPGREKGLQSPRESLGEGPFGQVNIHWVVFYKQYRAIVWGHSVISKKLRTGDDLGEACSPGSPLEPF